MLRVDGTSVCNVILCCMLLGDMTTSRLDALTGFRIHAKALSDLSDSLRPEGTFRIWGAMSEHLWD